MNVLWEGLLEVPTNLLEPVTFSDFQTGATFFDGATEIMECFMEELHSF